MNLGRNIHHHSYPTTLLIFECVTTLSRFFQELKHKINFSLSHEFSFNFGTLLTGLL
jgi:hypothetical protein